MMLRCLNVFARPRVLIRMNSSKVPKDIYSDVNESCTTPTPKPKKIGNLVVEEEAVYQCKGHKNNSAGKKPNCWAGRKGLLAKKLSPVSHVIFNLDGVVLDSEKLMHEAHTMYLMRFKKGFPNKLKIRTSGLSEKAQARVLIDELGLAEIQAGLTEDVYAQGMRQYFRGITNRIHIMPGAINLICHLHLNKVPIALVTSNTERMFKLKTRCFPQLLDRFCHITLRSDPLVKKGKPDPDILNVAISKFKHPPRDRSRFLAVEDSIAGARAAKAAGMQVLFLPSKPIPPDMAFDESDLVVNKLSDVRLTDFNLPPLIAGVQYT